MPTAQVNGIGIYYELAGAGEPLLIIGGLGADLTLLAPLIPALAARFQVLTFDNRGAGRSSKPDTPYTIAMMAGDAAGLLAALSIERTHVLGISMGGRIALGLVLAHPGLVRKLVLVSTSAAGRGRVTMSLPMRLLGLAKRAGLLRPKHSQPGYAHERQRQASVSYDAAARLGEVRVPTLILHARRDRSMPLAMAERMQAGITGSRLVTFPGGHAFFLLTQRKQFLGEVTAFLAEPA
jgi:3-oxoadipate enol-lactonase